MKADKYQIIIDTNVLLSAMRSRSGASFRLLSMIGDSRFQTNLSVALVLEYEDVLKRPENKLSLSDLEIDDILDYLCKKSNLREIFYLWRPTLPNPEDDFLLELAVESDCDYIVTFNTKDFIGTAKFGVQALRPNEFLRIIGEIS